jgi:spermidine synthase
MKNASANIEQEEGLLLPSRRTWAIFLISVLGLFLEMLLIRWIGTEVRIFAYLQNTVLIACFLGLGLGCFTCRKPINLRQSLIPLFLLVFFLAVPVIRSTFGYASELLSFLNDLVIWGSYSGDISLMTPLFVFIGLVLTFILLFLIIDIFVPIGRLLGRLMDDHPNTIWAYSVNVAGSLAGTWLFVLLSSVYQPPLIWFLVFGLILSIFIFWSKQSLRTSFAIVTAIIALAWYAGFVEKPKEVIWSPYQKLAVEEIKENKTGTKDYFIAVNNIGYQAMLDLSKSNVAQNSEAFSTDNNFISQYDMPLLLHPDPQSYLIVGAGSGNDVAGGLRQGVKDITAVEIDPAILQIGKKYHPEAPYSVASVDLVRDDARSFFATTTKKFDVISFGLLDSHTTTAMTNARLDHYVYTRESITRAKTLLSDGGIMVLMFEAQKPYITDRIARVLNEVFGEAPIVFRVPQSSYGWGGVMFITGDINSARTQIAQNQNLNSFISWMEKEYPISLSYTTKVATDDWPYIYLESPKIPVLYYLLAGVMLLLLFLNSKRWGATDLVVRWHRSHWHFFFLGAAFLLLEVQNISKASVVLGNTWEVNAVIISSVLSMILLANLVAYRFPKLQPRPIYASLILLCLILYFVDLAQFAFLPYPVKAFVVGSLTALPMLFSGIIFIRSFAIIKGKDEALGANLVGAIFGALLQSVTFVIGIKALLLLVAGLYLLSMLAMPVLQKEKQVALKPANEQS